MKRVIQYTDITTIALISVFGLFLIDFGIKQFEYATDSGRNVMKNKELICCFTNVYDGNTAINIEPQSSEIDPAAEQSRTRAMNECPKG
jgi:hypothetical protein